MQLCSDRILHLCYLTFATYTKVNGNVADKMGRRGCHQTCNLAKTVSKYRPLMFKQPLTCTANDPLNIYAILHGRSPGLLHRTYIESTYLLPS